MSIAELHPGEVYRIPIEIKNVDLTGHTVVARFTHHHVDEFSLTLQSPDQGIVIDPDQVANKGKAMITIPSLETEKYSYGTVKFIVHVINPIGEKRVYIVEQIPIVWPSV